MDKLTDNSTTANASPTIELGAIFSAASIVDSAASIVDSAAPIVDSAAPIVDSAAPIVDSASPIIDVASPTIDAIPLGSNLANGAASVQYIDGAQPYLIKINADGSYNTEDFRISILTDTHLIYARPSDSITMALIEKTILAEKPDLFLILGDICVDEFSAQAAHKLASLFEKLHCYWAFVFGNHDGENRNGLTRRELFELYSRYPHCLAKESPVDIWGQSNYFINIANSENKVIKSLCFLDSGLTTINKDLCAEHGYQFKHGYDYIKPTQIEWYKNELNKIAAENGSMPSSILFIHIALQEYKKAYKTARIFGKRREKECCSHINSNMFAAIKELKSTDLVVCGHDHINDYIAKLDGVTLMYALSSSFGSYYGRNRFGLKLSQYFNNSVYPDGHTALKINQHGNVDITQVYNQTNSGIFSGLEPFFKQLHIEKTLPKK